MDPAVEHPPRVIRGRVPEAHEHEARERWHYESGDADRDAELVAGESIEPWLNVLEYHEPGSRPTLDWLLGRHDLRAAVQGTVLDVGAGTCWLSAELTKLPEVLQVFPIDLSERFLSETGVRVMRHLGGHLDKVTLVASDFNEIPLPSSCADCAFLFAAIHHSRSPLKTLEEIARCLRPGGVLYILESPQPLLWIRRRRRAALALSDKVTEYCYTFEELMYLLQNAPFAEVIALPVPAQRAPWKAAVRLGLRKAGLEHVLLNPDTHLFKLTKSSLS